MEPTKIEWEQLLALSKPSFEPDKGLAPFGFSTRVGACVNEERRLREIEILGWRAFLFSSLVFMVLLALRISTDSHWDDVEPGASKLLSIDTTADL